MPFNDIVLFPRSKYNIEEIKKSIAAIDKQRTSLLSTIQTFDDEECLVNQQGLIFNIVIIIIIIN